MNSTDLAERFRQLHVQPPLVLPNAWDAGSARVIEDAGAQAIATTSAGMSWAKGLSDGQCLSRSEMIQAIFEIVRAVSIPVSVDIESGYGEGTLEDISKTVELVLEAGAVGINLEDAPGHHTEPLLEPAEQAKRIRVARDVAKAKGLDLFINARTDVYLASVGDPKDRLTAVIERAEIYLDAGADGIFVPAIMDAETISELASNINAPLNIMAGPSSPDVQELVELGVSRISLGPAVALGALNIIQKATKEALMDGSYNTLNHSLSFAEANSLFTHA